MHKVAIPADLDFAAVAGFHGNEAKAGRVRPQTLARRRASRRHPAALNAISIHLTLKYKQ